MLLVLFLLALDILYIQYLQSQNMDKIKIRVERNLVFLLVVLIIGFLDFGAVKRV